MNTPTKVRIITRHHGSIERRIDEIETEMAEIERRFKLIYLVGKKNKCQAFLDSILIYPFRNGDDNRADPPS